MQPTPLGVGLLLRNSFQLLAVSPSFVFLASSFNGLR